MLFIQSHCVICLVVNGEEKESLFTIRLKPGDEVRNMSIRFKNVGGSDDKTESDLSTLAQEWYDKNPYKIDNVFAEQIAIEGFMAGYKKGFME